jgi:outer membrane biosynthesis protein TonB
MASRDSQTVILSRQTILLVTAVGVGLLTLCYVLGVQVGKQSAALRRPAARGAGEDLQELPAAIGDQIRALETAGRQGGTPAFQPVSPAAPSAPAAPAAAPAPAPAPPAPAAAPEAPARKAAPGPAQPEKAEPAARTEKTEPPARPEKAEAPAEKAETPGRWTLQLISTPDQGEAQRMAAKANAAGYPAAVVTDKGLYKVRLSHPSGRSSMDTTATHLKSRGFKPFAIKVE